jgi:hypothetical protein
MRTITLAVLILGLAAGAVPGGDDDPGYVSLFDGETLEGWNAPDMSYFSVQDGAITGEATPDHTPPRNQFLVWQGGMPRNFDLKFRARIFGEEPNAGMQFRSEIREHGLVHGYQADIVSHNLGGIWDEYGPRMSLAAPGESVVIDEDGEKKVTSIGDPEDLAKGIDLSTWNEYRIIAKGPHIVVEINGRKVSELVDRERGKALSEGVLAVPVITRPVKYQYKDIRLKTLP